MVENPPPCIFCYEKEDRPCFRNGRFDADWLAKAYLAEYEAQYGDTPNPAKVKELDWAPSCLTDLDFEAPEIAFQVMLKAMNRLQTVGQASYLAAGTLEQVIVDHGSDFIDRIESIAKQSPRFRFLLTGVWSQGTKDTEVWKRVQQACGGGPNMDAGDNLPSPDDT